MSTLASLRDVRFVRSGRAILTDLELVMQPAERVAIVGPNGAGKSTLLRIIAAMETPDAGCLERSGRVAWIPQSYSESLFPWFSVIRNIAMPRTIAKIPDAVEVATRLAAELLPGVHPKTLVGTLSGGQQQATAIARALAWPSDWILADEPFSAIDTRAKPLVRKAFRRELGDDRALLLVTHDPRDAEELCDRVLVLESGRLVAA